MQLSKDKIDLELPLGIWLHYICNIQKESKYEMCALQLLQYIQADVLHFSF